MDKRTNNNHRNTTQKTKILATRTPQKKTEMNQCIPEG